MNDGRIECSISAVSQCKDCYGTDINYKIICTGGNTLICRAVCGECGYSWSLPHTENLARRTNTTLANWRKQVIKRDQGQCRVCGNDGMLEAHHIIPVSHDPDQTYKYDVNNGITLCKVCHKMVHNIS